MRKLFTVQFWKPRLKRWVAEEQIYQHEDKLFLVLTLLIGAIVGLVIAAFIVLTENLGARMYPPGDSAWRRLLIPIMGSLITGALLYRYFPGSRGSGIPQTKVALILQDGVISLRTVLGRFGLSSISLASGIALGREGPSVQIGAGIASVIGRNLGLGSAKVKALIPIGVSAALAAAFNTPIAAVLFTLEEVMGDMHAPVLGSIVLSSATSWIVLHLVLGDEPLFHVPSYQLVHPAEFLAYAALGVVGGMVSVGFTRLLLYIRKWFLSLPKNTVWIQPVAGGLLVGVLGWFVPDVLGVGYAHVGQALNSQLAIATMAMLVVLKIIATSTCYASGNAGGIFGPSLFIGAMMGGALGSAVHGVLPDYTGSAGAYALVGMGTAFAGIIRTPMTSVIMIFEITRDYSIIVPVMISNLISYFIATRLQPDTIYESLQHQEGIYLPPPARIRENVLSVQDVAWDPAPPLHVSQPVRQALGLMRGDIDALPVLDGGMPRALVTRTELLQAVEAGDADASLGSLLLRQRAPASSDGSVPHVFPDDPLDTAMRRMADVKTQVLPVFSRTNVRHIEGLISLPAILSVYGLGEGEPRIPKREVAAEPLQKRASGGVLMALASVAIGLMIVIAFLSYHYRSLSMERAGNDFEAGNELLVQGRPAEAVEQYRNALSASPGNAEYRLTLAMALIDAGNPAEAEVYLRPLLQADPNNGRSNLAMGRAAARQNKPREAADYYHRAIYGVWPPEATEEPLSARFELVDYLRQIGANTQAVSELLALSEQVPANLTALGRVGDLLLQLGSAKQASEIYQSILRQDDRNAAAYQGLALAQISMGNYPAALTPLRNAVKWNSGDDTVKARLATVEEVVALNPSARGLSSRERYNRSQQILQRSVNSAERCLAASGALSAEPGALFEGRAAPEPLLNARRILQRRVSGSTSEAVDQNIALAEQLRNWRASTCEGGGAQDDVLDQVLTLLAR